MKKDFLALFLVGVASVGVGCNTEVSTNNANRNTTANLTNTTPSPSNTTVNSPNSNTNSTNTNASNTNSANANVEKKAEVRTFTDAPTALAEANKLFDGNKEADSIDYYKQAVKLDQNLAEAHFKLGMAYSISQKDAEYTKEIEKSFNDAVKAYQKVLAKNPKDDVAQFNLGRAYNKLNKDKEAESALRKATAMKPNDAEYQTELGAILIKFAKYPEAIGILKKAQKLDEQNSRATDLIEKAESGKKREETGRPQVKKDK